MDRLGALWSSLQAVEAGTVAGAGRRLGARLPGRTTRRLSPMGLD